MLPKYILYAKDCPEKIAKHKWSSLFSDTISDEKKKFYGIAARGRQVYIIDHDKLNLTHTDQTPR